MKVGRYLFYASMLAGGLATAVVLDRALPRSNNSSTRNSVDAGVTTIHDAAKDIPLTLGEITGRTLAHCPPESILCDFATGLAKTR